MRTLMIGSVIGWMIFSLACPATTHQGNGTAVGTAEEEQASDPALTSDQLEEIKRTVRVGTDAMVTCYEEELERQGKKISCKVMIKLVINVSGTAEQIDIEESNIQSDPFTHCMVQTVRSWEFPKLPKATPYSFPFAFSPAY